MFKFLKDKLKKAVSSISESITEEVKEPEKEVKEEKINEESLEEHSERKIEESKKKGFFSRFKKEPVSEEKKETTIKAIEKEFKEDSEEADFEEEIKEDLDEPVTGTDFLEKVEKQTTEVKEAIEEFDNEIEIVKKDSEIEMYEDKGNEKDIEPEKEVPEVKQGFFSKIKSKITHTTISDDKFEELFNTLELALMESNVALEVIDKIKEDLKKELIDKSVTRKQLEDTIKLTLKKSIEELFEEEIDLLELIKQKESKPYIISFVGINGVGKTTSLAKVAKRLQENNISCVIAAADTFRVAAIEQINHHAINLGIKIIKHDYGADPAAVCYDAIEHAKSKAIDVVLIDTAGRNNVNINLMEELKKVIRVAKPDLTIFIGDSLTGNDMVDQAKAFDEAIGIDAIILSKADADEKGGGSISVSYITHKPIIYIGTGQEYKDLEDFSSEKILQNLGLA